MADVKINRVRGRSPLICGLFQTGRYKSRTSLTCSKRVAGHWGLVLSVGSLVNSMLNNGIKFFVARQGLAGLGRAWHGWARRGAARRGQARLFFYVYAKSILFSNKP